MKKEIKILIVEDSQDDFLLILREFKQAGYEVLHERVYTAEALKQALTKNWDIILSDYRMPNLNGLEALEIVKKTGKDTPFLIVSGSIGEDAAVEILKKGAADYIMKDRIARLVPEVERELKEAEARREKVRMEQALVESELKYRELVDEVNDGYFITDKEGVITFVNSALAKILGYRRPEEVIGRNFMQLLSPDVAQEFIAYYKSMVAGKKVEEFSMSKIIRPDGKEVYLEVKPVPIHKDSKIAGSKGIIRDITERKQLEQQLRQSQKMEAVGRLAGGIAHDFNNLLTVILGYSEILANRIPKGDPLHKDVDEVKKSAIRAATLTKQLLAFSRKQVLQPRKINLNNVVTET